MGIPDHLTCFLRNLYAEAIVRTGHGTSHWFQIGKGVGQCCILSPCLFNFYAEYIMWNARLDEVQGGIKIAWRNINNLTKPHEADTLIIHQPMRKPYLREVIHCSQGHVAKSVLLSSLAQLCLTLCDLMDCSMPGFPVHHQLPELTQTQSIESVMPSNHLILCCPLLLLPSIFPSIRVFSKKSVLRIRWPKYCSFSFSINTSNEYSDWLLLGLTGWISLQSKGVSRVFSNTIVQKHQFFSAQLSL